ARLDSLALRSGEETKDVYDGAAAARANARLTSPKPSVPTMPLDFTSVMLSEDQQSKINLIQEAKLADEQRNMIRGRLSEGRWEMRSGQRDGGRWDYSLRFETSGECSASYSVTHVKKNKSVVWKSKGTYRIDLSHGCIILDLERPANGMSSGWLTSSTMRHC